MLLGEMNRESKIRLEIAKEIILKCPLNFVKEAIVVGSVSRGAADENSDIEIEFLNDRIPTEEERINWIKEIGAAQITSYGMPISDGSMWIIFKYKDYWIEAGWQSIDAMKENIENILKGKVTDHERLLLAWTIKNAICLTEGNLIENLQLQLKTYPYMLQKIIISSTLKALTVTLALKVKQALAARDDRIPLLERLIVDIKRILRILFALNGQWEPDWKRIEYIIQDLTIIPENLYNRINKIITIDDSNNSLKMCLELLKDTLLLIPDEFDDNNYIDLILRDIKSI